MPNIEIKARYTDLDKAHEISTRLRAQSLGTLRQIDTYFHTAMGRLKLREIPGQGAWLIPYSKTYEKRPSRSDYQLLEVKDPQGTKSLLATWLGTRMVVDKTREVFLLENVRIHIDQVKGLGTFIEFEAVFEMDTAEVRERETRKVAELMQAFGIVESDLLTSGYADLLDGAGAARAQSPSLRISEKRGYYYLSNPYNGADEEREKRFQMAALACGRLLRLGVHAWSPIVHNHAMISAMKDPAKNASHGCADPFTLEERRTLMLEFDFSLLRASVGMIVLELEGWDRSYGVRAEIKLCEELGLPIQYLSPSDLASGRGLDQILRDSPLPSSV